MKRTRIKICGITSIEDAQLAVNAGCDAIGLNFYDKSPRFVELSQAKKICASLPAFINKVALFVNPSSEFVQQVINSVVIDTLQFHGNEQVDFCQQFHKPYIKTISVSATETESSLLEKFNTYQSASSILLDSFDPIQHGGTGESFNWNLIPKSIREKIILAGGLNPQNVMQAIESMKPYAIDVSSGVECFSATGERIKGKKDVNAVIEFIKNAQIADQKNI